MYTLFSHLPLILIGDFRQNGNNPLSKCTMITFSDANIGYWCMYSWCYKENAEVLVRASFLFHACFIHMDTTKPIIKNTFGTLTKVCEDQRALTMVSRWSHLNWKQMIRNSIIIPFRQILLSKTKLWYHKAKKKHNRLTQHPARTI